MGDAAVVGQGREVQDLPGAASAETEEGLEDQKIGDIDELPDIAFKIGGGVVGEPFMGWEVPLIDPRVTALP